MSRTEENLPFQIRMTMVVGAALAVAAVIGVALLTSARVDQQAIAKQIEYVKRGPLRDIIAAVPREQESITVWDDHVTRSRTRDLDWLAQNVGEWMYTYYGHDRAYVLDDHNSLIYAMRDGESVHPANYQGDGAIFEELAAGLRKRLLARAESSEPEDVSEMVSTRITAIAGRPAVLSVRPIIPATDRVHVPAGEEFLYASMKFIDVKTTEKIAEQFLLEEPRFSREYPGASDGAVVPVTGSDGETLGYLTWKADKPGIAVLEQLTPVALFALIVACGMIFFLGRRLRHASLRLSASEHRARHLASHDTLTSLPNRALFEKCLDDGLRSTRTGKSETALLFLDLDRFKNVNDTLGHRAGDELVRQAASRLREVVGAAGTVARIGGDEFAIVISLPQVRESATGLAESVVANLTMPFNISNESVHVGVSIGIAIAPEAGCEREELLRKADIALYEAKKHGRGCYLLFSEPMGDILKQRRAVEADLRKALEKGDELRLFYQPLYTHDGMVTGAEALLRWSHPIHGNLSPMFMITIAEEAGMIMQLGDWILREACHMAASIDLPWVAVNVSAVQLRDEHFADRCLAIIREIGVEPQRIQIEVTETVLIQNPELTATTLRKLRAAGLCDAIDDFGTGYSSMSYLQNYPIDRLKIDRSFVGALSDGDQGRAIVSAMLAMARALKLDVTAEGVETADQRDMLSEMGCREMQGYFFSRPLCAPQLSELIEGKVACRSDAAG